MRVDGFGGLDEMESGVRIGKMITFFLWEKIVPVFLGIFQFFLFLPQTEERKTTVLHFLSRIMLFVVMDKHMTLPSHGAMIIHL